MCRTSREPVRAMAAASSPVMSSKVCWQPSGPCCWMGGISARPTHYAVGAQGQSLKNVHTVFKRSVYKNRDLSLHGLYNFRQNHQCRHRRGHNPVVVRDQDPAHPGV